MTKTQSHKIKDPEKNKEDEPKYRLIPSVRFLTLILAGLMIANLTTVSSTISIAWVCMVNDTNHTAEGYKGDLSWGKTEQQYIFSSYFFGAILALTVPGYLVDRFGVKIVGAAGLTITSTATLLIPVLARHGFGYLVAIRILVGIGTVVNLPVVFGTCSRWTTKAEIGTALSIISMGSPLGRFGMMLFGGLECSELDWTMVFYFTGGAGMLLVLFWLILYADDPESDSTVLNKLSIHRYLSDKERQYILNGRDRTKKKVEKYKTPWFAMLTSLPVWAVLVSKFAAWSFQFFFTAFTPTYLKEVLSVDPARNGIFSSLPQLMNLVGRFIVGPASDRIQFRSYAVSVKVFNSIAFFGAGACSIGITFVQKGAPWALVVFILCLQQIIFSFCSVGYRRSVPLIAPDYSGTIGSLMNSICAIGPISTPYLLSALTPHSTAEEWKKVFYLMTGVLGVAGLFFIIFGDGKVQSWAKQKPKPNEIPPVYTVAHFTAIDSEEKQKKHKTRSIHPK